MKPGQFPQMVSQVAADDVDVDDDESEEPESDDTDEDGIYGHEENEEDDLSEEIDDEELVD